MAGSSSEREVIMRNLVSKIFDVLHEEDGNITVEGYGRMTPDNVMAQLRRYHREIGEISPYDENLHHKLNHYVPLIKAHADALNKHKKGQ